MLPRVDVTRLSSHFFLTWVSTDYQGSDLEHVDASCPGAKPNVLNKEQLSPFHVAIKSGNSKIVRFILEKRGKLFQDYHPSKATPLRCTPLQLAIESNDKATIELLVKHATTHNVERCWKAVDLSEEVRDILRTKVSYNGFGLLGYQLLLLELTCIGCAESICSPW